MARLTRLQFMDRIKACFDSANRCEARFGSGGFFQNHYLDQAANYAVRMHIAARREREARAIRDAYMGVRWCHGSRGGGKTARQESMLPESTARVLYRDRVR